MKFVCLVYIDEPKMAALTPEEGRRLTDATIAEDWDLRDRGHLIFAQPLQPPERAVTLRLLDAKLTSTDGPFAETKEHLGGFFVIEARDMAEATAIAGESAMLPYGSIEIRPCLEQTHSESGIGRPQLRTD